MSDPYMYTSSAFQPTPYLNYSPYAPVHSPFIPPTTFPSSPLPPASPYLAPTTTYPQTYDGSYDDTYYPPRSRRLSWHAGMASSPYLQQIESPYRSRRRSFSNMWGDTTQFLPWAYPHHGTAPHFEVHPLLNADAPFPGFHFNLASPTFSPMRAIGPGQYVLISPEELCQPATNPPICRMRLTHDSIPLWPIDLELRYDEYQAVTRTPITVGDVLYMIYSSLRRQITHHDWYQLSDSKQDAISRAYHRRCRSVPSTGNLEVSQGVRRVDYLKDKYMFRGLIRARDGDGFFHWRFVTERRY
ncbi:hypothetical protein V8B97DRAFT_1297346 [Scleroderma yunnanense]